MSVILNFKHITESWHSLRRFAGCFVESALDAVKRGHVDIAPYFTKLLYFLPFAPRSLEKVLYYSFVKASYGFIKKDPKYYEISTKEVPGFNSDEIDKIKTAFEFMHELDLATIVSPDKIRLKLDNVNEIVRYVARYVMKDVDLHDIDTEVFSYPYRMVSGVNSLYVMHKYGRLPKSFTIMTGLVCPTVHVKKGDVIKRKLTISSTEWNNVRSNMSLLTPLRDIFEVEYFKAVGFLYENRIIVRSYPLEISGTFVDLVISPAYRRYYTLTRERKLIR